MAFKRILVIAAGSFLVLAFATTFLAGHYRHQLYQAGIDSKAASLGLQAKAIEVNNTTWAYLESEVQGQKPTLVMLHGFGASKETWLAMSQYLVDDYHLVMPDLAGHGGSSFDASQNYDLENQTRLFAQFVDALGLQRFHLMGNSMGGGITGIYAGTHRQRLLSATLLGPAGIVDHSSDFLERLARGENPLLIKTVEDLDFLLEYAVAEKTTINWPFNLVLVERAVKKRPVLGKVFADLAVVPAFDYKAAIAQITAPTLVIWGKHDRIFAPENAAVYKQLNPAIQVEVLDGAGHIPMVESPETCAEMFRQLVADQG